MRNVTHIHPKRVATPARKESVDDYLARLEQVRQRKGLDPRLCRAMEATIERLLGYIDLVYRIDEAADGGGYSASSGPMQGPRGGEPSDAVGEGVAGRLTPRDPNRGRRRERSNPLDVYLRRDVRKEFDGLTRHLSHVTQRATEALYGQTRRRAKLSDTQVSEIRRRLGEGESKQALADEHGVTHGTIRSIESGRTWKQ